DHGGTSGQSFPAPIESTGAERASSVDYLMTDFRMRAVHAAIEMTVQNNPAANPSSDSDVDEPRLVSSRAPACFSQPRRIGVVFESNRNMEVALQIVHQALAAPLWKKIVVTETPGKRVDRTGCADADTCDGQPCCLHGLPQHVCDES